MNNKESIRKEESKEGRKWGSKLSKYTNKAIYIAPKSTHESRRITALEPVRGSQIIVQTHRHTPTETNCSTCNTKVVNSKLTLARAKQP